MITWIAKTFFGLEEVAAQELESLGATEVQALNRAVKFSATLDQAYSIIPAVRTSHLILRECTEFQAQNPEQLYQNIKKMPWEEYLDKNGTFKVEAVCSGELFTHSKFVSLKIKDAVADYFRESTGVRPSVEFEKPDLIIHAHIHNDTVRILFNACDVPLFKRGYRIRTGPAPINECLAAGILMLADWQKYNELWDPMCGSGTFSIEAVLIKKNIAPNAHRNWFGFMGWKDFNLKAFQEAIKTLKSKESDSDVIINAADNDQRMIHTARENAQAAGVDKNIKFYKSDMRTPLFKNNNKALVVLNPPYDQRMHASAINSLYAAIGDSLKQNFTNKEAFIISSNKDAMKHLGLKPSKKRVVFNGGLESQLYKYEIFSGDYKSFKTQKNDRKRQSLGDSKFNIPKK